MLFGTMTKTFCIWGISMYSEKMREVLTSGSASNWVKLALIDLTNRDVLDALNDVELLKDLMMLRWS